jgi:low affinity Fe/Cu permease
MAGKANSKPNNIKGKTSPSSPAIRDKTVHHSFISPQPPGWFERFARGTALLAGRPATFLAALGIVVVWMATGPIFRFSDTWQLVINTGTTIVTFLMVFLIQQSQNRDTMAEQIKLAELIIAVEAAHNALATAEDLSEEELTALHQEYCKKAEHTLIRLEAKRGKQAVHVALHETAETAVEGTG